MQHFWSHITEIHVFLRHFTFSVYAQKKREWDQQSTLDLITCLKKKRNSHNYPGANLNCNPEQFHSWHLSGTFLFFALYVFSVVLYVTLELRELRTHQQSFFKSVYLIFYAYINHIWTIKLNYDNIQLIKFQEEEGWIVDIYNKFKMVDLGNF